MPLSDGVGTLGVFVFISVVSVLMHVLEQLISELRQERCVFCRLEANEPWRIFKSFNVLSPFYVTLSGEARVTIADTEYHLRTNSGLSIQQKRAKVVSKRGV